MVMVKSLSEGAFVSQIRGYVVEGLGNRDLIRYLFTGLETTLPAKSVTLVHVS